MMQEKPIPYHDIIRPSGTPGSFPACFAFSVHKCGSSLMHGMIQDVCDAASFPRINIPGPMFQEGYGDTWKNDTALLDYIGDGFVYTGYRYFPAVFRGHIDFSRTRNVLLIRDPRDVLVSQFFSFKPGGSHVFPKKNVGMWRKRLADQPELDIDEYAIRHMTKVNEKMMAYRPLVVAGYIRVFKYEEILFDKQKFLMDIFEHFCLPPSAEIISRVANRHHILPAAEDPAKHIRKAIPGDYKEKLKSGTIARLNEGFRDVANLYGYTLS